MTTYPKCYRIDCFGNKCGARCDILTKCDNPDTCSFYKTEEEVEQERMEAHKHLKDIKRDDLIKKYEYNSMRRW